MEAQEIIDWIKQKQKKGGNPEEWLNKLKAINELYDSDKVEGLADREKLLFTCAKYIVRDFL